MSLRVFLSEFRLYVCNHFVNKIPIIAFRMWFYRKVMGFKIGERTYIFLGCTFDTPGGLEIGEDSVINANCRLDSRGGLKIGSNVSISNDTVIITADHDMANNMEGKTVPVEIEDYVWVGTNAMFLPGAYVSRGSVVAARALVTKAFKEQNLVLGGVPAKVLKIRENPSFDYHAGYKRLFQ